jgi:methyl-accepting chemotaxis protein
MKETRDPKGIYFISDLYKAAQKGGGFVQYSFNKPGKGITPKISYAELIPNTNIMIGSGLYLDNLEKIKQEASQSIDKVTDSVMQIMFGATLLLLLVVLAPLTWGVMRSILNPVSEARDAAMRIADGDLDVTLQIEGRDEMTSLEKALNTMVQHLKANVTEIQEKTAISEQMASEAKTAADNALLAKAQAEEEKQLALAQQQRMTETAEVLTGLVTRLVSSTEELSAKTQKSTQGMELQSQRIIMTAAATEEMNATVNEVAKSAAEAASQAERAKNHARSGTQVVSQTTSAIQNVQQQSEQMKVSLTHLNEQVVNISRILEVITEIADQTNLIALNAAIEAARAGDAGKGFAVVADEVRQLAKKTMDATDEVKAAVDGIQKGTQENLHAMESTELAVAESTAMAKETSYALEEIVGLIESSADQVSMIASAAEEQAATSTQIAQATDEINQVSAETAKAMSQAAQVVESLNALADELKAVTQQLRQSGEEPQLKAHGAGFERKLQESAKAIA